MPNIPHLIVKNGAVMLAKGLTDMKSSGNLPTRSWDCNTHTWHNITSTKFNIAVERVVKASRYAMMNVITS